MAENEGDEDQWLYGDSSEMGAAESEIPPEERQPPDEVEKPEEEMNHDENLEPPPKDEEADGLKTNGDEKETFEEDEEEEDGERPEPSGETGEKPENDAPADEDEQQTGAAEDDEEDDDDDSEDDVRVTIGDLKTAPQYSNLNIKRGANLSSGVDKLNKIQPGKFSIEEFESIGTINGVAAHEFSIDALEDKPWRKPGADITDYFNYGFNEDTWRAYCERQKQLRVHESGVGLGGLGVSRTNQTAADSSMYSGMNNSNIIVNNTAIIGPGGPIRKAGPPPGPRRSGVIDVIGAGEVASRRTTDSPPNDNTIQVMTADRRDYGRKGFDLSVPPPGFESTPPPIPVIPNYPPHGYNQDFYQDVDPYYRSYEPAQDMQWGQKEDHPGGLTVKQEPMDKSYKDRERDRERERERDRHKDRHRHRSRSRSIDRDRRRKHHSRSRSPGHSRSHKKKKSKKSDRKDSD